MANLNVEFNQSLSSAVFLTHRRGVGIFVARKSENILELMQGAMINENSLENDTDLYVHPEGIVGFSRTTTAEKLAYLYQRILSEIQFTDSDIHQIVVGMGPGSFTGLRLGCAFANGLVLGRKRALFGIQNLSDRGDNFTGLVDKQDFLLAFEHFQNNLIPVADFFVPAYGKEPGPVLKLQGLI